MSLVDFSTIRRLKAGDEAAFRSIYDSYSEKVYQLAIRFLKEVTWSEELTQDVFMKLWINREGLDERGNIWLYLYVITKRLCLNKLREIHRSTTLFERLMDHIQAASERAEDQLMAEEAGQCAEQIIAMLPQQQQRIFKLSREEGLTHDEIAKKLGISTNTVKNHMVRALKTLKTSLHHLGYIYMLAILFSCPSA